MMCSVSWPFNFTFFPVRVGGGWGDMLCWAGWGQGCCSVVDARERATEAERETEADEMRQLDPD